MRQLKVSLWSSMAHGERAEVPFSILSSLLSRPEQFPLIVDGEELSIEAAWARMHQEDIASAAAQGELKRKLDAVRAAMRNSPLGEIAAAERGVREANPLPSKPWNDCVDDAKRSHSGAIGWSPGWFRGDHRVESAAEVLSCLVFEFENGHSTFEQIAVLFTPYLGLLHTSLKHTSKAHRMRVVLPLSRDVTPGEYDALQTWVMELCNSSHHPTDTAVRDASRLWYLPVTARGGEFLFRELTGEALNPDAITGVTGRQKALPEPVEEDLQKRSAKAVVERLLLEAGRLGEVRPDGKRTYWCVNDDEHSRPCGSLARAERDHGGWFDPDYGWPGCSHRCSTMEPSEQWRRVVGFLGTERYEAALAEEVEKGSAELLEQLKRDLVQAPDPGAHTRSNLFKVADLVPHHREEYLELAKKMGAKGVEKQLKQTLAEKLAEKREARVVRDSEGKEQIQVSHEVHEMEDQIIATLGKEPHLYQFGGALVTLIDSDTGKKLVPLARDSLPGECTRTIYFYKMQSTEAGWERVQTKHPLDAIAGVHSRPDYGNDVRRLKGIVRQPVLAPSGLIVQSPGYDPGTGLYLDFRSGEFPSVPVSPTRDDAVKALQVLSEPFIDFRFEGPDDAAVLVAAILTGVALDAFDGPSPGFIIEAPSKGAGKSLLVSQIGVIAFGEEARSSAIPKSETEALKERLAKAAALERFAWYDNIPDGMRVVSADLELAITTTRAVGRELGHSKQLDLPYKPLRIFAGNNIAFEGALDRRVLRCRLQKDWDLGEERDFAHFPLPPYVKGKRPELYAAALTALRAFICSEVKGGFVPLESFDDWSRLIVGTLLWCGWPNPLNKLAAKAVDAANPTADLLTGIEEALGVLGKRDGFEEGEFSAGELYDLIKQDSSFTKKVPLLYDALSQHFNEFQMRELTSVKVGYLLRSHNQTVGKVNGKKRKLVSMGRVAGKNVVKWKLT